MLVLILIVCLLLLLPPPLLLLLLLLQVGVAGLAGVGVPQAAGGHGLPCGPLWHPHALQVSARLHLSSPVESFSGFCGTASY
jgi:hypothetical protein